MPPAQRDPGDIQEWVLESCPTGVVQLDLAGNIAWLNPTARRLLKPIAAAPEHENLFDLLAPHDSALWALAGSPVPASGRLCEGRRIVVRGESAAVSAVLSLTVAAVPGAGLAALITDVTPEVVVAEQLACREGELRAVLDGLREQSFATLDLEGRITGWNRSGERLEGYRAEEIVGRNLGCLFLPGEGDANAARIMAAAREDGWAEEEGWRVRRDGGRYWGHTVLTHAIDPQGRPLGFHCMTRDLAEQRRIEERLREAASTDFLTGALNRRQFFALAEREAMRLKRHGHPLCLVVAAPDRFRWINGEFGQEAGDAVLRRIAALGRSEMRSLDLMGRLGSAEFAILLPETDGAGGLRLASRLREAAAASKIEIRARGVQFTLTLGIAQMAEGQDLDALIAAATTALLSGKREGGDRTVMAAPEAAGRAALVAADPPPAVLEPTPAGHAPLPSDLEATQS